MDLSHLLSRGPGVFTPSKVSVVSKDCTWLLQQHLLTEHLHHLRSSVWTEYDKQTIKLQSWTLQSFFWLCVMLHEVSAALMRFNMAVGMLFLKAVQMLFWFLFISHWVLLLRSVRQYGVSVRFWQGQEARPSVFSLQERHVGLQVSSDETSVTSSDRK